jgi:oligopeptide transport system permease protein
MSRFIIRRLLITIPTMLVVITLTWGLIRLAPGNFYTGEKKIPKAIEANIKAKYGLDKPWYAYSTAERWSHPAARFRRIAQVSASIG